MTNVIEKSRWEEKLPCDALMNVEISVAPCMNVCTVGDTVARNIRIEGEVHPDFQKKLVKTPKKGVLSWKDDAHFCWTVEEMNIQEFKETPLIFQVQHVGKSGGRKQILRSIRYQDRECRGVRFTNPAVNIECSTCNEDDHCVEFCMDGCQNAAVLNLKRVRLGQLGRIVTMHVTMKHVCPGKRVALAVILEEINSCGCAKACGIRVLTVPAQEGERCRDVRVECIQFVIPEKENGCGAVSALCRERCFRARVLANYMDTEYVSCEGSMDMQSQC